MGVAVVVALLLAACTGADPSGPAPTSPSAVTSPTVSTTPSAATPTADVPGATGFDRSRLRRHLDQDLEWAECGGRYECASLLVPSTYAEPDGDDLRLALVRLPARDRDRRVGTLVVNPGGPGGSGVEYVRASTFVTSERLRERYDLVGLDPRGVQGSRPAVDCLTDRRLARFVETDASPDTPAELRRLERVSRAFGAGCARRSPDLVDAVGTRDAALDLEVLRVALGEVRLDFLGKSYGTLLGLTYAEAFPDRVGRMVLDGVLDPALDAEAMVLGQVAGFERAFRRFVADCSTRPSCPFGRRAARAQRRAAAWVERLDAHPVGGRGERRLTQPLAQLAIMGSLYEHRSQWPALRSAIRSARAGSPSAMLALADATVDRRPDGTFGSNAVEAQYAVTCLDRAYDGDVAATRARAERAAAAYPVLGEYLAWSDLPCSLWPVAPTRAAHPVTADLPPVLVLGTAHDPATPFAWARSVADRLGDARLVRWVADGHTAYSRGSDCVDDLVDDFLVAGRLPAGDRTCRDR